jgi:hypothetical protein
MLVARWWSILTTQSPSIGIYARLAKEFLPKLLCALALVDEVAEFFGVYFPSWHCATNTLYFFQAFLVVPIERFVKRLPEGYVDSSLSANINAKA